MKFRKVEGGVTAAKSFLAAGVAAGLKKNEKKIWLIYSQLRLLQGMFTKNRFQAAPVLVSREHLADGRAAGHHREQRQCQCLYRRSRNQRCAAHEQADPANCCSCSAGMFW